MSFRRNAKTGYEQPAEVGGDAAQPLSGRDMSSEVAGGPAADERCCFGAERPESGGQTRALQLQIRWRQPLGR